MISVLIGSLAPPVLKAEITVFRGTPYVSNKIVPALTLAAQWSTVPFPLPILTSVGFIVIGTVGNIRIHTFPFRFNFLTIACRAASICRDEIVPDLVAFNPIFPNFIVFERKLNFDNLPFCTFLYLVFLGCNNMNYLTIIFA